MTEHAQARIWGGIDVPKTIAGTLAAVSAAVVGSFLGVAGTVIGAAVASLISSVGTEIYHRYLDRGTKRLQATFMAAPAAVGTPEVAAAQEPPSGESRDADRHGPVERFRWKRIAMVAGALFVLAMGTLTTAELLAGRSAADATSGRHGGSPTIFDWSGDGSSSPDETPGTATVSPTPDATATDGATEPAETATTGTTGTATTAPADEGTATDPEPEPTATGDTGGGAETGETGEQGTDQDGVTGQSTAE
ncbi:hypothetical protein [Actinoplanes sp. NPDC051851]|uniref:hypothetical protein n=1 Tax=Actinoplanes sp. NPDC051851 TaxID=3154753 RepID=UPI00343ACEB9